MVDTVVHYIYLSGGLLAVMPLLLILTIAVSLERWWLLTRTLRAGKAIQKKLRPIAYGDIDGLRRVASEQSSSLQGHLIETAIASRGESAEQMDGHLEEEIMDSMPRITRLMWILDTAVTIAPLLGLVGTIIGMIQAFNVLSAHGGPAEVTGGIADALISTGAGLMIAIVAVFFMNFLNTKTRQIVHQMELIKLGLVNRIHGNGVVREPMEGRTATLTRSYATAGA